MICQIVRLSDTFCLTDVDDVTTHCLGAWERMDTSLQLVRTHHLTEISDAIGELSCVTGLLYVLNI